MALTAQRLINPLVWSAIAAIILYGILVIANGLPDVLAAAKSFGMAAWLVVIALELFNLTIRFIRWRYYLRQLGHSVPWKLSFAYYIGGFAFTLTPGRVGEAVRSFYLKRHQVTYGQSISVLFVERLTDVFTMIILALSGAYAFENTRLPFFIVTATMLLLLPLIHSTALRHLLERISIKSSSAWLKKAVQHIIELLKNSAQLLRSGSLYAGIALGIAAFGAEGLAFYFILQQLGSDLSMVIAVGIYAVSLLAGAATFMPGGLGSIEAVMSLLLVLTGTQPAIIVAAVLIFRFSTLWFAVILGIVMTSTLEMSGQGIGQSLPGKK